MFRACIAFGLIAISVSTGAFAILGIGDSVTWREEARLHDGSIMVVERIHRLGGRPTLESRDRAILDEIITFSASGTGQKITWRMSFRDDVPEPNGVNVVLLGIVNNVPYIAGYPAGCIAYNKWNRPNPPQILFKYVDSQWKRIALADFPLQLVQANIIVGGPRSKQLKPLYSVAQVDEENRDIDTPEYKSILRTAVKRGAVGSSVNCVELVFYKGSWVGPGDSIGKRMMDSKSK